MNSHELELLDMTTALRTQMLDLLIDPELSFMVVNNATLGELCRDIGNTERMYIESFKTLVMPWGQPSTAPSGVERSIARLKAWYAELDKELIAVLSAIPEEDLSAKAVDRGGGFMMPLGGQFHTYREALLIFYGRCSIYLRALGKELPLQWRQWIG